MNPVACAPPIRGWLPLMRAASRKLHLQAPIFAVLWGIGLQAAANDAPPVPDALAQGLARVRVVNETRRLANGSGVAVREDMLITSCHGTRNARWIDVLHGARDWKVLKLVKDTEHDLCLIQIDGRAFQPFVLARADNSLEVGDYVAAVGFTGPSAVMVEGSVKALHTHDGAQVIQTDAAFKSGESGGALLDRERRLVGILTFYADETKTGFFAVPVKWVRDLVKRAERDDEAATQPENAFWERQETELPLFMRALAREYAQDWENLQRIAAQWVERDQRNPEAWLALGKAYHHVSDGVAAVRALQESTRLAPRNAEGWYYLGRAYAALKQLDGLTESLRNLDMLNSNSAQALRELLNALTQ